MEDLSLCLTTISTKLAFTRRPTAIHVLHCFPSQIPESEPMCPQTFLYFATEAGDKFFLDLNTHVSVRKSTPKATDFYIHHNIQQDLEH